MKRKHKRPSRFVQQTRRTPQLAGAFLGRRLLYIGVGVLPIVWVWGKNRVERFLGLAGFLLVLFQLLLLLGSGQDLLDDFFPPKTYYEDAPKPIDRRIYLFSRGLFFTGLLCLMLEINWLSATVGGMTLFWKYGCLGAVLACGMGALLQGLSPSVYYNSDRRYSVLSSLLLGLFLLCPAVASCANHYFAEGDIHCQSHTIERKTIGGKRDDAYWFYLRVRDGSLERFGTNKDLYVRRTEGQSVELCTRQGWLGYALVEEVR